jgi:pimeloyl-ACP methyl ester carboxylesterase
MMKKVFKFLAWLTGIVLTVVIVSIIALYQPDIQVDALKEKYAGSSSKFMEISGMQVHYRDEGPSYDSVPLVLLHGTGASLLTWDACTADWVKSRRVIRMDLPAFGLTGPAPDDDYRIERYVDFLHRFLQKLQVSRCYLAGNSLGGLIAYSYAAAYPGDVQKLILLDAAGYPIENAKGNLAFNLGRTPVVKHLLKIVTPAAVVRKSLEDVYGNKALVTDALVEQYHDMACREGNRNALVIRLNNPQSGDTSVLPGIKIPTLVIWGDQDFLIPLANAFKFQRDLPIDTLVVLKGIGHVPMEESPGQVISLVKNFID